MNETQVPAPIIHPNGSGSENLYDRYTNAREALDKAVEMLLEITPNMRDYYPQGDCMTEYKRAIVQHKSQVRRVEEIKEEIQQTMLAIDW